MQFIHDPICYLMEDLSIFLLLIKYLYHLQIKTIFVFMYNEKKYCSNNWTLWHTMFNLF
jgi:hypothetical protein